MHILFIIIIILKINLFSLNKHLMTLAVCFRLVNKILLRCTQRDQVNLQSLASDSAIVFFCGELKFSTCCPYSGTQKGKFVDLHISIVLIGSGFSRTLAV